MRRRGAYLCEFPVRDPADGAFERGGERDVLRGVVDIFEDVDHRFDFGIVADVVLGGRRDGHAAPDEFGDDALRLCRFAAREHGDVLEIGLDEPARREVVAPLGKFFGDDRGDLRALAALLFDVAVEMFGDRIHLGLRLFLLFLFGQKVEPHPSRARGVQPAAAHERGRRIVDRTGLARHARGKDRVHGIEHRVRAAEIAVEFEGAPFPFELFVFAGEKRRAAPAEAVNGLLRVAHHEYVFARNEGEDLFLRGVDVLIFVHEHVGVLRAHFFAHFGDAQKFEALVLEVGKVEHARPFFEPRVFLVEREDDAGKGGNDLPRGVKARAQILLAFKAFERFFHRVGKLFQPRHALVERERVLSFRAFQFGVGRLVRERNLRRGRGGGKQVGRIQYGMREGDARVAVFGMFFAHQPLFYEGLDLLRDALRLFEQPCGAPLGGRERLVRERRKPLLRVQSGDTFQKRAHVRAHAGLFVRFAHEFTQTGKPPAARECPAQKREVRVALFQAVFEQQIQRARFKFVRLRFFRHAEVPVRIDAIKVAADDVGTERVQRADVGGIHRKELVFQKTAAGSVALLVDARDERLFQAFFHLLRREVGKGHGEHGLRLRPAREDEGDDLFDHDERFSAPRGSGNEDAPLRVDRRPLFGRGFPFAHCPLLLLTAFTMSAWSIGPASRGTPSNPHTPP